MPLTTRIYKDLNSLTVVIERLGNFPLNSLEVVNDFGDNLTITQSGNEVFSADYSELLDQTGAAAGSTIGDVLAYLAGEFAEEVNNVSISDVQAEVNAEIANLTGNAPGALDSIQELADALGDNPTFAADISSQVATAQTTADQGVSDAAAAQADADQGIADAATALSVANQRVQSVEGEGGIEVDNADPFNPIVRPVFGANYAFVQDGSVSIKPDNTPGPTDVYSTKVELSVTLTEAGVYRLGWSYLWNSDTTTQDFEARIVEGLGTPDESEQWFHKQEPKDSAGDFSGTGSDQSMSASGFENIQLQPGTHTFTLQWRSSVNSSIEASIWNAEMEFWRVR